MKLLYEEPKDDDPPYMVQRMLEMRPDHQVDVLMSQGEEPCQIGTYMRFKPSTLQM